MESIGIADVLDKMSITTDPDTNEVRQFALQFLTRDDGARHLSVRKYTRGPRQAVSGSTERGKASHNLQANGNVMMWDVHNERIIEVKAAMIYAFQDFKSNNWLKVYH